MEAQAWGVWGLNNEAFLTADVSDLSQQEPDRYC